MTAPSLLLLLLLPFSSPVHTGRLLLILLYVRGDHEDYYDREPRTATSTFTQLLSSENRSTFVPCCFTSTEALRTVRDGEPRTTTFSFAQLLSSEKGGRSVSWFIWGSGLWFVAASGIWGRRCGIFSSFSSRVVCTATSCSLTMHISDSGSPRDEMWTDAGMGVLCRSLNAGYLLSELCHMLSFRKQSFSRQCCVLMRGCCLFGLDSLEDIPLVGSMHLVFTRMPGESYRGRFRSLLLCSPRGKRC